MGTHFYHNGEEHVMESCFTCKVQHSIPLPLYKSAQQGAGTIKIHCPYGHTWVYKSEQVLRDEEKLRIERDRLKQQLAQKDDEINRQRDMRHSAERSAIALKGVVTRTKNRVGNGVCPCCSRTFTNLQRHMHNKHPDYKKEDVA